MGFELCFFEFMVWDGKNWDDPSSFSSCIWVFLFNEQIHSDTAVYMDFQFL
jgi:hypothetical protein